VDVTAVMSAFQGMNNCRLTVEASVEDRGHLAEMTLQLTAWRRLPADTEAQPSVLLSVRRKVSQGQTLAAAILQLMYALDFQLAEAEWAKLNEAV
jgi:hypothetical protein